MLAVKPEQPLLMNCARWLATGCRASASSADKRVALGRDLTLLRVGSAVLRLVSVGLAGRFANRLGQRFSGRVGGIDALERNLSAVGVTDPRASARKGIGAYAKYWVDTLRLPNLSEAAIDRRFSFLNYHHILDVQSDGKTPIMVLPHLGSWEWAAAWLGKLEGQRVVAVVEQLEPVEVFEWFKETPRLAAA